MDLETQGVYLKIIEEDFTGMKNMLDYIREKITPYPVYTQLAFIREIKRLIVMAWCDACDDNNEFLNNHDGGDRIEV